MLISVLVKYNFQGTCIWCIEHYLQNNSFIDINRCHPITVPADIPSTRTKTSLLSFDRRFIPLTAKYPSCTCVSKLKMSRFRTETSSQTSAFIWYTVQDHTWPVVSGDHVIWDPFVATFNGFGDSGAESHVISGVKAGEEYISFLNWLASWFVSWLKYFALNWTFPKLRLSRSCLEIFTCLIISETGQCFVTVFAGIFPA